MDFSVLWRRPLPLDEAALARFRRKTGQPAPNGCIPWTGGLNHNGYGSFNASGKRLAAHRLAYEIAIGPVPAGLVVDHTCHNKDPECAGGKTCPHRRCVNPDHLEAVTSLENISRGVSGGRRGARFNPMAKACPNGHPLHEGSPHRRVNANGRVVCRPCSAEQVRQWKKANPAKVALHRANEATQRAHRQRLGQL